MNLYKNVFMHELFFYKNNRFEEYFFYGYPAQYI